MRQAVLGTLIVVGSLVHLTAQGTPAKDSPRFEVASIKPNPERSGGGYRPQPNRFSATGNTVAQLITLAYQLRSYRIVGGEDWIRREGFDIDARITGPRTPGDLSVMLRHLLEDRFALRVHPETRPIDVYILTRTRSDTKLGPNVKQVVRSCSAQAPVADDRCGESQGVGRYRSTGRRWEDRWFVGFLEAVAGRPIVDRTGLSGQFDIALEYNPDISRIPDGMAATVSLAELEARPLLFTALREQLGLKLEQGRAPLEVLVIDNVERPTSN